MRIVYAGDFRCGTGLARVTEAYCSRLAARGHEVIIHGFGYDGGWHPFKELAGAWPAGEVLDGRHLQMGPGRLARMVEEVAPDVVVLNHDVWQIMPLQEALGNARCRAKVVGYCPVDADGYLLRMLQALSRLDGVATYTEWGADVLLAHGVCKRDVAVIGHGLEPGQMVREDRASARAGFGLDDSAFLMLSTDTNTARKRLDIMVAAFALFLRRLVDENMHKEVNPLLYLHNGQRLGVRGFHVQELFELKCHELGISGRGRLLGTSAAQLPLSDDMMRKLYAAADLGVKTCWGEGWGLTVFEQAAQGVASVLPHHSALAELWPDDACYFVDAPWPQFGEGLATRGMYTSPQEVADGMWRAFSDRAKLARRGARAREVVEACATWDQLTDAMEQWLTDVVGGGVHLVQFPGGREPVRWNEERAKVGEAKPAGPPLAAPPVK